MRFEEEYPSFLDSHLQARKGERRRRLEEGLGHGELAFLKNVWWPAFQNFDYLHPEYEVQDFKDGKRYLDFAYIRPGVKICFEVDGYGPHLKEISRWQFADQLERQNHLMLDSWMVIRFSYDQVTERPRRCQQVTQHMVSKMTRDEWNHLSLSSMEKDVIRVSLRNRNVITPENVAEELHLSNKTARKILKELVQKKILYPASGKQRIRSYRLNERIVNPFF